MIRIQPVFAFILILGSTQSYGGYFEVDYFDDEINQQKTLRLSEDVKLASISRIISTTHVSDKILKKINILRFGPLVKQDKFEGALSMFILDNMSLLKSVTKIEFDQNSQQVEPIAQYLKIVLNTQFNIKTEMKMNSGSKPCLEFTSAPVDNYKKYRDFLKSGQTTLPLKLQLLRDRLEYVERNIDSWDAN